MISLAKWIAVAALVFAHSFGQPAVAAVPNIILLMADDQGWGDTGYNGHPHLRTPHLDQMAKDGIRFQRWYAAAPVCSPTRGSCLTGRHPFRYGVYFANTGHMKAQELTLAELLKAHGYATGHFGKWHLGTLTTEIQDANRGRPGNVKDYSPPWENGFEVNFSTESKVPTWDPMFRPRGNKSGTWWDPVADAAAAVEYGTAYWSQGRQVTDNLRGDDSRVIMDRALPFLEKAVGAKQPFFAVVWFHAPHLPVVAGPQYTAAYSKFDKYKQHYYGCITALDEQVGRLRSALQELGVADNTMIWYSADNGPEGNEQAPGSSGGLRGRKRSLYEGGIRVPGLVVWPEVVQAGRVVDTPCVTSDYLPTVLDVIGASLADDRPVDGVSLLPLLKGQAGDRAQPIGFQSRGTKAMVDNRYKLVVSGGKKKGKRASDAYELFDLVEDPGESRDVAAQHPDVVKRLAQQLDAWVASCAASDAERDY